LLFVGSYLLVLVQIGRDQPWPSLLGVLMLLAGLPFYVWSRRRPTTDGRQASKIATEKR